MLDFLLDDNSEDNAESEITAFMRERADPDTDSLAWWKNNSDKYSRLSVLVRRYFISKFYISTIIVKIQLNDNKFKNINLLFTTQYKLFTTQYKLGLEKMKFCQRRQKYSVCLISFWMTILRTMLNLKLQSLCEKTD
jgi:hypothetical protein